MAFAATYGAEGGSRGRKGRDDMAAGDAKARRRIEKGGENAPSGRGGSEMEEEWFSSDQVERLKSLMFNYVQTDGNYLATKLPRTLWIGH